MVDKIQISLIQFKIARLLLNMSQGEVSATIGVCHSHFSRVENQKANATAHMVRKIIVFYAARGIIFHKDGNVTLKKEQK